MKIRTINIIIILLLAGFFSSSSVKAQNEEIVIIVNNENPVTDLTISQTKLYFLKKIKLRWPENNQSIKPVDRLETPQEKQTFYSKVLKMSSEDVEQYFIERQISNAIKPPEKKSSDLYVVEYICANKGAIGYISKSTYDNVKSKVKAVLYVK